MGKVYNAKQGELIIIVLSFSRTFIPTFLTGCVILKKILFKSSVFLIVNRVSTVMFLLEALNICVHNVVF